MADSETKTDLLAQTVQIVASFVAHNTVAVGDLPRLIEQTHAALRAQFGEYGRSRVEQHFTPQRMASDFDALYARMLA